MGAHDGLYETLNDHWVLTNISKFSLILLIITYLFEVIWGLNNLNFTSDNKIYSDFYQFWGFKLF